MAYQKEELVFEDSGLKPDGVRNEISCLVTYQFMVPLPILQVWS